MDKSPKREHHMDVDSDDDEYEEESTYVVFDLGTEIAGDALERLTQANGGVAISGIDTTKPIMQLGAQYFEGTLDEYIGDPLLFEINERKTETSGLLPLLTSMREEEDAPRQPRLETNYKRMVNKVFKFEKVEIHKRTPSDVANNNASLTQEDDKDDDFGEMLITDTRNAGE
ncbi:hypothetical protein DFQ28_005032 [Apophysomyces sp. BC1034]|nr:hypothetical protein DFQ30_000604 [Apophysomyces sp. BC1015]KAG0183054.1 hypothetical protein DFQ29_000475 [Apophysomyces sp. BC1021]KAG0194819.1 hypothetical protein DFQ28_005032 [Apophysomyces sp. BC1034]